MIELNKVRSFNVGSSNYSKGHKYQVWDIWIKFKINNPFDGDLVKRTLRIKQTDPRILDYKKMVHICSERIRQFVNGENVFAVECNELKDVTLEEMIADYDITDDDVVILNRILYPNVENRVSDYQMIIDICNKRIKELEK